MTYYKGIPQEPVKHEVMQEYATNVFKGNGGYVYFISTLSAMSLMALATKNWQGIQAVTAEQYEDAKQLHDMRTTFPAIYRES